MTPLAPTTPGRRTSVPPPTQAPATPTGLPDQPTPVPPTPSGENNPPAVQRLAPAEGAQISSGQTIWMVALAADDSGIRRMEFYADKVLYNTLQTPNLPTAYQAVFAWSSAHVGNIRSRSLLLTHPTMRARPGDVTWNFKGQVTASGSEIAGRLSESRAGMPSLQKGTVSFRRERIK